MTLSRRLVLAAVPTLLALPAQALTAPPQDLVTIDRKIGFGDIAREGRTVTVQYTGWLFDPSAPENKGYQFDNSYARGQPFTVQIGIGKVIPGWDQGIPGMKVGGIRELIIPADLAYGSRSVGGIPANSALIFDVELLAVR